MGHLAICNNQTVAEIISSGYISGKCSVGEHQEVKTVADLQMILLIVLISFHYVPIVIEKFI